MSDLTPQRARAVIRRQRVLLVILVVALVVCVAGVVAARYVKSPAQQAAQQAPPPASVVTSPVVSQVLTQAVTVRGSVDVSSSLDVVNRLQVSPAIVTRLPVGVGSQVDTGTVIAEISGQPVFVMTGAVPAYRDMAPGDKGTDVEQLQRSLQAMNLLRTTTVGTYDSATAQAAGKLFTGNGYANPGLMPLGTVVFVPALPATVGSVATQVGADAGDPGLMTLDSGDPVVHATIPAGQETGVATGQSVTIRDEVNRRDGAGTVDSIGQFTPQQTDSSGVPSAPGFPVTVTVTSGVDASWVGASVAVTITMASTPAEVLSVPVAAVQTAQDGHTYVTVSDTSGTHDIQVTTGMIAQGVVEVTAATDGALQAGDQVVVG
ncbi:MAG: hypothetical protein FWF25_06610 [Propionibacteriaceae bacterium]|nr:hypothetical protein [Propionibacteriaceae bacterium]